MGYAQSSANSATPAPSLPSDAAILGSCNAAADGLKAAREYITKLETETKATARTLDLQTERAKLLQATLALREAEATQLRAALDAQQIALEARSKQVVELKTEVERLQKSKSRIRKLVPVALAVGVVAGAMLR